MSVSTAILALWVLCGAIASVLAIHVFRSDRKTVPVRELYMTVIGVCLGPITAILLMLDGLRLSRKYRRKGRKGKETIVGLFVISMTIFLMGCGRKPEPIHEGGYLPLHNRYAHVEDKMHEGHLYLTVSKANRFGLTHHPDCIHPKCSNTE